MGYYINTGTVKNKASEIVTHLGGTLVPQPASFSDIPADKALIVVVDNGTFEAAGVAYDAREFADFTLPTDNRPKQFVLMDQDTAFRLSGYTG